MEEQMNNYYYDGDFDGLLSVVFEAYPRRTELGTITDQARQIDWAHREIYVSTDLPKARRVETYLREKISEQFFYDVQTAFLSSHPEKDTAIVHTIFAAMEGGEQVLDSMQRYPFLMNGIIKQVLSERHRYLGLLRFREMQDGTLFATMEPKHNVLPLLINHFKRRLQNEAFAIYDKKRAMVAYYNKKTVELYFTQSVETVWSDEEKMYNELWKAFHQSISIRARTNRKLQRSNLPKYYWKYLIEEME